MKAHYATDLAQHVGQYLVEKGEKAPSPEVLEEVFETLFFASLRHEESQPIACRVAFIDRHNPDPIPPEMIVADRWKAFPLAEDIAFSVANLVKLSQAVDPWGATLAIDVDRKGSPKIWGLIDQSVHFSTFLVKETSTGVEMPGLFQAAIEGIGEISAYKRHVLIGSLKHDLLIERQNGVFQSGRIHQKMMPWVESYCEAVIKKAKKEAYESRAHWKATLEDLWFSTLCRILIGIQRYGHGGAVLISSSSENLTPKYLLKYPRLAESLVKVGVHKVESTYYSDQIFEHYLEMAAEELPTELYSNEYVAKTEAADAENELRGCIRFLTSLSRVDGLLWFAPDLCLQGFGVEIGIQQDPSEVYRAKNSEGNLRSKLDPNHFGMRHRSMIRYCGSAPDSVGFVVSQDGDVRAVTKSAHSVLLWENVRLQSVRMPKFSTTIIPKILDSAKG